MARVLFAWEFGGDLGHVRRIVSIARELRAMGHEAAFAFRDLAPLGALAMDGAPWFQAPWVVAPRHPHPSPLNASDILLNLGFGDAAAVSEALRGWLSLLRLWRADAVVADYAPAALLAARAAGLPAVTIGSGFSVPPPGDPLPALRPWAPADPRALAQRDARLVAAVRAAFSRLGQPARAPSTAAGVFEARAHLLCTSPQLDPFGPRASVEYVGAQAESVPTTSLAWRGAPDPRVLAYLKSRYARFEELVRLLAQSAGEAIVAAPGLSAGEAAALSDATVRVVPGAVDLEGLLPDAALAVSHAGPGFAGRALAAGVPLALVPMQLEQFLVATRLRDQGVATVVSPEDPGRDLSEWLRAALADGAMRDAARKAATAPRPSGSAAARIATLLET